MSRLISAGRRIRSQLKARANMVDAELRALWRQLVPEEAPALLLAVGGYGRERLFKHSDVDLVIIHSDALDEFAKLRLQAFAAASWSTASKISLSTRDVASLRSDLNSDHELRTTLLYARPLAGHMALVSPVKQAIADCTWSAGRYLEAKTLEQRQRHARYADTAYGLEPNVKDGPGGLRDLDTLRWVYAVSTAHQEFAELKRAKLLDAGELVCLESCERLLSALREALHHIAGRAEDRLLFDHQLALAKHFGFVDQGFDRRGVEQLMQQYFRTVSDVRRVSGLLWQRLQDSFAPARSTQALGHKFRRIGSVLEHDEPEQLGERPTLLIEGLRLLASFGLSGFGPRLSRWLSQWMQAQNAESLLALRAPWVDLLRLNAPAQVVRISSEIGLLSLLLPAFEQVRGRMQFDLFHVFTVDEHTLRLLERLQSLQLPDPDFALPLVVWGHVRRPELLFLAGLFHDIAKGRGGDHSVLGAEEARSWLRSVELSEEEIEIVAWLVREHLTMSTTAQKKDIHDPAVVAHFAAHVGGPERLHLLFLLTVADIQATNPKLWNGWKARLLGDLYEQARYDLRRGMESRPLADERARAHRESALGLLYGEGASAAAVHQAWSDFPADTFVRLKPDELRWITQATITQAPITQVPITQATIANQGSDAQVAVRRSAGREGYQVFVRAPDQPGLFATITAVLDRLQLSVLGARIATCPSGASLDTFQAVDLLHSEDAVARAIEIRIQLSMALAQKPLKPKLTKRLASRQQRQFRTPLKLGLEPVGVFGHQQLAVVCTDQPGILARIALVFHELGYRVHAARIATFGERVEDFFELSTTAPEPVIDLDALRRELGKLNEGLH